MFLQQTAPSSIHIEFFHNDSCTVAGQIYVSRQFNHLLLLGPSLSSAAPDFIMLLAQVVCVSV